MAPVWFLPCVHSLFLQGSSLSAVSHGRRHLDEGYERFKCYQENLDQKVAIRIGVMVDKGAYDLWGGNDTTVQKKVEELFERVSKPYKENLGIILRPKHIFFPHHLDDPLLQEDGAPRDRVAPTSCKYATPDSHLDAFGELVQKNQLAANYTTWVLLSRCTWNNNGFKFTSGVAFAGTACQASRNTNTALFSVDDEMDEVMDTMAHELGHSFGAMHPFESTSRREAFAKQPNPNNPEKLGIMNYFNDGIWKGKVQFHEKHEGVMCDTLDRILGYRKVQRDKCVESIDNDDDIKIGFIDNTKAGSTGAASALIVVVCVILVIAVVSIVVYRTWWLGEKKHTPTHQPAKTPFHHKQPEHKPTKHRPKTEKPNMGNAKLGRKTGKPDMGNAKLGRKMERSNMGNATRGRRSA